MDSHSLPSVEKVKATVPLTDLQAFDMMSRFLQAEKAKHLSLDIVGQSYLSTSSQIWNDLRLACNSLLEHNDHRREAVAEWKIDPDMLASPPPADQNLDESTTLEESTPVPESTKSSTSPDMTDKEARRSAKKEKKEQKRKLKEEKRSAKKAKKDAKKAKKEAKKRKRESLSP